MCSFYAFSASRCILFGKADYTVFGLHMDSAVRRRYAHALLAHVADSNRHVSDDAANLMLSFAALSALLGISVSPLCERYQIAHGLQTCRQVKYVEVAAT